jgi:hypothetical protein
MVEHLEQITVFKKSGDRRPNAPRRATASS